uniref:Uncharacterized protein LOC104212019 n=1 Tax=Nicotiana sylvestris TaxID=4096 RepID=A0A1U7UTW6_NICSY|nr:PREDICTED: uncharacterized protein LOC104212019 [Nicotiana sylvestris]
MYIEISNSTETSLPHMKIIPVIMAYEADISGLAEKA